MRFTTATAMEAELKKSMTTAEKAVTTLLASIEQLKKDFTASGNSQTVQN
jgi:hypothetical protein